MWSGRRKLNNKKKNSELDWTLSRRLEAVSSYPVWRFVGWGIYRGLGLDTLSVLHSPKAFRTIQYIPANTMEPLLFGMCWTYTAWSWLVIIAARHYHTMCKYLIGQPEIFQAGALITRNREGGITFSYGVSHVAKTKFFRIPPQKSIRPSIGSLFLLRLPYVAAQSWAVCRSAQAYPKADKTFEMYRWASNCPQWRRAGINWKHCRCLLVLQLSSPQNSQATIAW